MRKFIIGLTALLLTGVLPQLSAAQDRGAAAGAPIEWESAVPDQLCDYCEDYRRQAAADPSGPISGIQTGDAEQGGPDTPSIALTTR